MKLVNSSIFVVLTSAIAVFAVYNFPSTTLSQANSNIEAPVISVKSYILQGASPAHLNQLVNGVGGNVSREFPIINAVSAMLTFIQAEQIRELGSVRILDDRSVTTSGNSHKNDDDSSDDDSSDDDSSDDDNNSDDNNGNNGNGNNGNGNAYGHYKKLKINNHIAEQSGAKHLHDRNIKGNRVTVAVIDSGVNMGGTIGNYLFTNSKGKQRAPVKYDAFNGQENLVLNDDQNGHGSHIAGIIASSLDDGFGIFNGIAPDINLLSVKAFDSNGESSYSKVLDALNWIFENRKKYKIRVVNMSLGAKVQGHYWNDPINQAVMRLWDAGIVVVSSAGNNGEDMGITVPGNTPYIITVGAATDNNTPDDMNDDRLATFSAKGPTYEGFVKPEVLAYGSQIATKLDERFLTKLLKPNDLGEHYSEVSGTSQAAAIVSGIAALIISNDKNVTPDEVKCRIMQTAIPAGNDTMASYSPFEQGAGLVNAYAAIESDATDCANINLNIKEDLLGINHFIGPAKIDDNGDYFIELSDGTIFTKGMHWSNEGMNLEGMHWSNEDMDLEGMYWGDDDMDLEGMYWSGVDMGLQGMHWGDAGMSLKGMQWGSKLMNINGMQWAGKALDVQGMHWGSLGMGLQSTDLDVEPIDPDGEVPIIEDGWH